MNVTMQVSSQVGDRSEAANRAVTASACRIQNSYEIFGVECSAKTLPCKEIALS